MTMGEAIGQMLPSAVGTAIGWRDGNCPDRLFHGRAGNRPYRFALIASIGVAAPVVLYFALGSRASDVRTTSRAGW
jgi:hypothetical protein